ncbi:phosphoethanolamine transferase [Planctobacterium marinum]|uniref:phosphoethanolamine transferase n=1 Tax=Planctobacterium marinum TaxID=1631968 RepID=UPI001E542409|nr:phosphoethanolamine--lipid A transferase [Planctobacterium marinum]MCC2604667.1 phosphoethanolamine--lipid A transferase [Planctobacterium marinum]
MNILVGKPYPLPYLTYSKFVMLVSVYIVLLFNGPFIYKTYSAITLNTETINWLFMLSIPILLTALSVILISWLSLITYVKPVAAISVILSAILFYATINYGVIFDKSMVQNVVETNTGEVLSYLSLEFFVFLCLLGILPSIFLCRLKIIGNFRNRLKSFLILNLVSIFVCGVTAVPFYQDYASTGRNHRDLTSYIVPFAFYTAGFKYLRNNYFYPPLPFRLLDSHPIRKSGPAKSITLVVVGETARAKSFFYQGYHRQTNPYTRQLNVKYFSKVKACGTATAISVPCMFSRLNRHNYDARISQSQENVLDIIQRSGVDVTWIDNNSSCKGVCARLKTVQIPPNSDNPLCDGHYCFDEVLVNKLKSLLISSTSAHQLIVLHMIGSHGPTYFRRYPAEKRQFNPDCPRSDIQNCETSTLINTYDNTIVYTDYVLSKLIHTLDSLNAEQKTFLYISDHGESLGEKGLYLHGFPYALAPEEQTHIPMIYWSNQLQQPEFNKCIGQLSKLPYSHDNLFDTLLGISSVETPTYIPDLDILKPCTIKS